MNDQELYDYMDSFEMPNSKPKPKKDKYCCHDPSLIYSDGYETCETCGTINFNKPHIIHIDYDNPYNKGSNLYKRVVYFRQKLELLNGHCYPVEMEQHEKILNDIKNSHFYHTYVGIFRDKTRDEILKIMIDTNFTYNFRRVLKGLKYSKYYKYMFLLISELFKVQCFKMHRFEMTHLACQWVSYENKFKKNPKKRKNSYNYNVVLHLLLEKNKIPYYELITLPLNHIPIRIEIVNLLNSTENL